MYAEVDLKTLIYRSYAGKDFDPNEISQILEKSVANNQSINVTGLLLYRAGIFLQLLEGEEEVLERLYRKIARDSRHEDLRILVEEEIETRMFDNWSMAFKNLDDIPANLSAQKDLIKKNFESDLDLGSSYKLFETLCDSL